jgi:hypothetical protein
LTVCAVLILQGFDLHVLLPGAHAFAAEMATVTAYMSSEEGKQDLKEYADLKRRLVCVCAASIDFYGSVP